MFLPYVIAIFSGSSFIASANSFLTISAERFPMIRLYFFLMLPAMASSSFIPPVFISLLKTIPPIDKTVISVVSAPIFTRRCPFGLFTSMPTPTASAIGFSTTTILLALTLASMITS